MQFSRPREKLQKLEQVVLKGVPGTEKNVEGLEVQAKGQWLRANG
jgi:hypothetical protein